MKSSGYLPVVISALLFLADALTVLAQSGGEEHRGPTPMRLVQTPTMLFHSETTYHLDMAGLLFLDRGKNDVTTRIFGAANIGVSLLDGSLYLEAGMNRYQLYSDEYYESRDQEFPAMLGLRYAYPLSENARLGFGYRYDAFNEYHYLIDYRDELRMHSFSCGVTFAPRSFTAALNAGFALRNEYPWVRDDSQILPHISGGARIDLGESFAFMQDFGYYQITANRPYIWIWTGIRYQTGKFSIDAATMLLLLNTVRVGIIL